MPPTTPSAAANNTVRFDDIRPWLLAQTPETLATLLLEASADNDRLRKRLLILTSTAAGKPPDLTPFRDFINRAIEVSGFVNWDEMNDYTAGIYDIAAILTELVAGNQAASAKELAEYAFSLLNGALFNRIYDQGELSIAMDWLFSAHEKACRSLKTDPVELAQYLYDLEINDDFGYYDGIARHYTGLLGADGAQRLKALARKTLENDSSTKGRKNTAKTILRNIALAENDTETLAALEAV